VLTARIAPDYRGLSGFQALLGFECLAGAGPGFRVRCSRARLTARGEVWDLVGLNPYISPPRRLERPGAWPKEYESP
jgi:hypothetical protein